MEFLTDYTFTILQHTEISGYKQFTGTFTIDRANSIVSGRYSDGESWGDSYKFGLNDKGEVIYNEKGEVAESILMWKE
jgi:hypothetical protein